MGASERYTYHNLGRTSFTHTFSLHFLHFYPAAMTVVIWSTTSERSGLEGLEGAIWMRRKCLESLPVPLEEPAAEICAWNEVCWAKRGTRACAQSCVKELIYVGVKYLNVAREHALLSTSQYMCYAKRERNTTHLSLV